MMLDLFIAQFAARDDGFVVDSGMHMNENLTPQVLLSAIQHGRSISGYMAKRDDEGTIRTHVAAIDFDEGTEDEVDAVKDTLESHDIHSLKVGSRRGFHLWVFIDSLDSPKDGHMLHGQVPAITVTRALNHALRLTTPELHKSGKAEVFPKSTQGTWPGGTLRMPLMKHPKSGLIYPVYDEDGGVLTAGQTTDDLIQLLTYCAGLTTKWGAIRLFAGAAPVEYPKGLDDHAQPRVEYDGPSATSLLATLGVQATPGRATYCPFHDDKRKSLSVAKDDARVWCKAPHCEANNGERGLGSMQLRQLVERQR